MKLDSGSRVDVAARRGNGSNDYRNLLALAVRKMPQSRHPSAPAVEHAQGQKRKCRYGDCHCRFMHVVWGGPRLGAVPVRRAGVPLQRARSLRHGLLLMVVERPVGMEPRWVSVQYQCGPGNVRTLVPRTHGNSAAFSLLLTVVTVYTILWR